MTDKQKILQIEISNIVDKMTNGLMHPITGKQMLYKSSIKALTLTDVVVPKGTLCCPECKSTDLKVAIHTDYNECNKCYHYWET